MRRRSVPGLVLAVCLAVPATWLGALVPTVGAPVIGLALGALTAALLRRRGAPLLESCEPGLASAARTPLQLGIVVTGFGFPIGSVLAVGQRSAVLVLVTLAVATVGAVVLGRLLALHPESALLVGAGTAICGASAIAAVTAVIRPATHRVGYAIATIFVFNIVAVLVYPLAGRLLQLSPQAFGIWAGTAINDTSSVLAAATTFGAVAVQYAVIVKLVRSLAIVPLCVGLQLGRRARHAQAWRAFPWFIVAFVAASITAGALPAAVGNQMSVVSRFLITVALAGVGTALSVDRIRAAGPRPIIFGGLLALVVSVTGLAVLPLVWEG